MITSLTHVLSLISNALLGPVIVALLALLAWTLLLAGGFVKELVERGAVRRSLDTAVSLAKAGTDRTALVANLQGARTGLEHRFARLIGAQDGDPAVVAQALAQVEQDIADVVARHTFITRVSPMLGLMGTLIPLGPALSGLAGGDMGALASNLVVAFTATVVGLLISGVCYGLGLARRTWYSRDLTDLEFVGARLNTTGAGR